MTYLLRIIGFALQDLWRNIWLSLVTVSILGLTLVSVNILVVFNVAASTAVALVEEKVDVSVYFKPTTAEDQVLELQRDLQNRPEVESVQYISQNEALEQFRAAHQDNTAIIGAIDELGENPLGATLRVKAHDLARYPDIIAVIDQPQYAPIIAEKDYDDRSGMIDQLSGWTDRGRRVAWGFILLFGGISALIVFNTVRVAIYTHREEIGIEKLVGATNWFVSLPFVIEGVIYAVVGILITIALVWPLLGLMQPSLTAFFGAGRLNIISYFSQHFFFIFGLQCLGAIALNVLASFIATRKYLKV